MTRVEMIRTCDKLAKCLETQTLTPWNCAEGRDCNTCPFNIPSTAEAAASLRALLNEAIDISNNMLRININ